MCSCAKTATVPRPPSPPHGARYAVQSTTLTHRLAENNPDSRKYCKRFNSYQRIHASQVLARVAAEWLRSAERVTAGNP